MPIYTDQPARVSGYMNGRRVRAGQYLTTRGVRSTSISGQGVARWNPIDLEEGLYDRIGVNISVAGEAGAVSRLGVWRNRADGTFGPGVLLLDAGTIPGDVAAGAEITIALVIDEPGRYWTAAVGQVCPTTAPTPNSVNGTYDAVGSLAMVNADACFNLGGVTGAFSATAADVTSTAVFSGSGAPARVTLRKG